MIGSFYASVVLSFCLLTAAFIYGISNKQIWKNELSKWYVMYLGFILVIEAVVHLSIDILDSKSTQYLYPIYVTGEFLILVSFFLKAAGTAKKWHIVKWVMTFYIFIETILLWYIYNDASNGYGKIISHITIICLSAILLIKNLKELEKSNPLSIIYATLFLYYAVSLFLFLIMNQLTEMNISIWIINNALSSILYGSSIYTFYKLQK